MLFLGIRIGIGSSPKSGGVVPTPTGLWLLITGFWDNLGQWDDTATWNDGA